MIHGTAALHLNLGKGMRTDIVVVVVVLLVTANTIITKR